MVCRSLYKLSQFSGRLEVRGLCFTFTRFYRLTFLWFCFTIYFSSLLSFSYRFDVTWMLFFNRFFRKRHPKNTEQRGLLIYKLLQWGAQTATAKPTPQDSQPPPPKGNGLEEKQKKPSTVHSEDHHWTWRRLSTQNIKICILLLMRVAPDEYYRSWELQNTAQNRNIREWGWGVGVQCLDLDNCKHSTPKKQKYIYLHSNLSLVKLHLQICCIVLNPFMHRFTPANKIDNWCISCYPLVSCSSCKHHHHRKWTRNTRTQR